MFSISSLYMKCRVHRMLARRAQPLVTYCCQLPATRRSWCCRVPPHPAAAGARRALLVSGRQCTARAAPMSDPVLAIATALHSFVYASAVNFPEDSVRQSPQYWCSRSTSNVCTTSAEGSHCRATTPPQTLHDTKWLRMDRSVTLMSGRSTNTSAANSLGPVAVGVSQSNFRDVKPL